MHCPHCPLDSVQEHQFIRGQQRLGVAGPVRAAGLGVGAEEVEPEADLGLGGLTAEQQVIGQVDAGRVVRAGLRGQPGGEGLGLARQLKNEIFNCPPIIVLTGRPQDAWLAAWSMADLAVPHPLDPIDLTSAVSLLARSSVRTA